MLPAAGCRLPAAQRHDLRTRFSLTLTLGQGFILSP